MMEEKKLELKIRKFLLSGYALHREVLLSPSTEVLRKSQSFRENLLAIVELEAENDDPVQKKIVDAVHSLEKSFHICEIFCLGSPTKELSLELALWLKEGFCTSSAEIRRRIEDIYKSSRNPEYIKSNGRGRWDGYWDTVYATLLQGDLTTACEILMLHSALNPYAEQINEYASTGDGDSDVLLSGASEIDVSQCLALIRTLLAHPYANNVTNGAREVPVKVIPAAFNAWRNRVRRLRSLSDRLPILLRIPELDTVFRILLGEAALLQQLVVRGVGLADDAEELRWTGLCLSTLLYVRPPPLSRVDLTTIIDHAANALPSSSSSATLSRKLQQNLGDLMSGNALPVLRALYHEGREFSVPLLTGEAMSQSLLEAVRDLCISSTAQLVQLLVLGSDSREVATQVLTSEPEHEENAVSFRENIFSELAVRLNASGFPLEIVLGYLSSEICPRKGEVIAQNILVSRENGSDQEVKMVARTLIRMRAHKAARSVLLTRAMRWLQSTSADDSKKIGFVKAVHFFSLAGDLLKVLECLDMGWTYILTVVFGCSEFFPGLNTGCLRFMENVQGDEASTAFMDSLLKDRTAGNSSDEMQSSAEAERARLAAVLRFARCLLSSSSCLSLWEEEEDESAGGEGEEGAGDFESPSLRLQLQHRKEQLAKALRTFCDVISSWFVGSVKVFAEDEAEEDKNQDRKRDDGPSLLAAILVPAAAGVGSDGDQLGAVPPMVPLRLWIPIIEMVAWSHFQAMEIAATTRDAATLSKSCSYRLLQLLQEAVSLRNLRGSDEDDKVIQDMQRKLLLGCLTDSILIANASSSPTASTSTTSSSSSAAVTTTAAPKSGRRKASDYFRSNFTIHR